MHALYIARSPANACKYNEMQHLMRGYRLRFVWVTVITGKIRLLFNWMSITCITLLLWAKPKTLNGIRKNAATECSMPCFCIHVGPRLTHKRSIIKLSNVYVFLVERLGISLHSEFVYRALARTNRIYPRSHGDRGMTNNLYNTHTHTRYQFRIYYHWKCAKIRVRWTIGKMLAFDFLIGKYSINFWFSPTDSLIG